MIIDFDVPISIGLRTSVEEAHARPRSSRKVTESSLINVLKAYL